MNGTAVWTGREAILWGGEDARIALPAPSVRLTPATGACAPVSSSGTPASRINHSAVWTGATMLAWGGMTLAREDLGDGAAYEPESDAWQALPIANAPSPRSRHTAVWTGSEMIVWGGASGGYHPRPLDDGGRCVLPGGFAPVSTTTPPVPHDERYLVTGYRIDDDALWEYFNARGGVNTFGLPVSRTFPFLGCPVQMFQRHVLQHCSAQGVRALNLLDPDLFPYTRVNGSTFPPPDPALKAATPKVDDPEYAERMLAFVQATVPDVWQGQHVDFQRSFLKAVSPGAAGTDDPAVRGLLALEVWGAPISQPMADPNNPNFVYQRFQRGILHYIASAGFTRGILLADYLKSVMLGPEQAAARLADLPPDLQEGPLL